MEMDSTQEDLPTLPQSNCENGLTPSRNELSRPSRSTRKSGMAMGTRQSQKRGPLVYLNGGRLENPTLLASRFAEPRLATAFVQHTPRIHGPPEG